ncbi:alpha/beta-hydrolase [Calocera cornea HHB12733]|uniref:Alpha/beta-hydrolase n=1 Tax=Calocera cornea HHB12733 TaxID=1353952 RepID=A0A165GFP7_9BASI|nr:alpha/beta-hydrolase [Calocera cornea HHB12733]
MVMMIMMVHLAGWAVVLAGLVRAAPSPALLGSDLTLLFQNDLNWTEFSQHQSAILLSTAVNSSAAASACSSLNEQLLSPSAPNFSTDLTHQLAYLSYTGQHPFLQRYWVAPASSGQCQAVGPFGTLLAADCTERLPALCAQSAGWVATGNGSVPGEWEINPPLDSKYEVGVQSGNLSFTGTRDQLSFRFLGVPYANPPVRFEYSTVYTGPSAINATSYQSQCTQVGGMGNGSENCLFLNIWTPYLPASSQPATSTLKPVLVWIHGGAFLNGMSSDPTFDGGALASRGDVVVITINYRLSTLGFFSLPDGKTNGSYGISDAVTALQWVQQYISAFGGDPARVTISGQSAGAASVRLLLGSPPAIGLFAGAILQSDPVGTGQSAPWTYYSTIEQEFNTSTKGILELTGCNATSDVTQQLSCVKAYDPLQLVGLSTVANAPVVDGTYVTTTELPLTGTGPLANVNVMIGNMRDDGAALIAYPSEGESLLDSAISATGYTNFSVQSILSTGLFPVPRGSNSTLDVFNATARMATDTTFRCLSEATATSALNHSLFKSLWYYQFERSYQLNWWSPNFPVCTPPVTAQFPFGDPSQEYFHCHSGDLYLVFGSLNRAALPYRDSNDLPFAQAVLDRWSSFIRTYNPNPNPAYLTVRGYTNTYNKLVQEGTWKPVGAAEGKEIRVLSVPEGTKPWQEVQQCQAMNLGLSTFG